MKHSVGCLESRYRQVDLNQKNAEVTVRSKNFDGGRVLVLPVLPGRLTAQHHDQGRVVILQRTNLETGSGIVTWLEIDF